MNLSLHNTALRWIIIVVKFEDVMRHLNLNFFTEIGQLMVENDIHLNTKGYVVLGTIQFEEHFEKMPNLISPEDLKIAQKYFYNQTKNNSADYHFGTTGSIFSFGYGPRYSKNPKTQHSIDRLANSEQEKKNCYIFVKLPILLNYIYFLNTETTFKKITEDDKRKLAEVEHRVYKALEHSLQCFNNHFVPLKNKLSPKISTLQPFMDIYPEQKYADKLLEKMDL